MTTSIKPERHRCGTLVATATVNGWIQEDHSIQSSLTQALDRFFCGDWGEMDQDDKQLNELTLEEGEGRLMGVYHLSNGERIYIITSGYGDQDLGADYCNTVVMAPSDY